jgi:hypothetical protein
MNPNLFALMQRAMKELETEVDINKRVKLLRIIESTAAQLSLEEAMTSYDNA